MKLIQYLFLIILSTSLAHAMEEEKKSQSQPIPVPSKNIHTLAKTIVTKTVSDINDDADSDERDTSNVNAGSPRLSRSYCDNDDGKKTDLIEEYKDRAHSADDYNTRTFYTGKQSRAAKFAQDKHYKNKKK